MAYHALFAGGLVAHHARTHGVVSPTQLVLAVFCAINAWICVCELALLFHSETVQQQHRAFAARHGANKLPSPLFLFARVPLRRALSLEYWAVMWSTYATLDPAYIDTASFGFCVDSGNGVTTLLPTIAFAVGMSAQSALLPARWLGMLGLLKFWQEMYGTCVYFFQYLFNRKYASSPAAHVWGIVVPANAIWIVCPALGMWACGRLILEGDYAVFGEGYAL